MSERNSRSEGLARFGHWIWAWNLSPRINETSRLREAPQSAPSPEG